MSYVVTWKFKGGSVEHVLAVKDEREARDTVTYMGQVNASGPFRGVYADIGFERINWPEASGPQPWHGFGGRRV